MGNILEEFWYGNINPQEQSKESNRAIKELIKLMGRNRDRLHDSMTCLLYTSCLLVSTSEVHWVPNISFPEEFLTL